MSRLTCRIFFSHKLFVVINKVNNIISTQISMLSRTCRCEGALQLPFHKPFREKTTHGSSSTNLDVLWREYKNRLYWEAGVTGGRRPRGPEYGLSAREVRELLATCSSLRSYTEKKDFSEYTHMLEQKGKNTRASPMGTRSHGTSSRTSWCYE